MQYPNHQNINIQHGNDDDDDNNPFEQEIDIDILMKTPRCNYNNHDEVLSLFNDDDYLSYTSFIDNQYLFPIC